MCTCINYKNNDFYFGRNLDLEYSFDEQVVITPRNYLFTMKAEKSFKTKYAIIGMATVINDYPLYAEACNEQGLCIAGLYFPNNARYNKVKKGKNNITPFELIPWILGNYTSVEEIQNNIKKLNIINIAFNDNLPLAPLHWMIADQIKCIVLEQMQDGLKIYDNPIGVLTNNPPFYYHKLNLNNYMHLTPNNTQNNFSNNIILKPYGQGMGAIGLPGDNSPSSRFIRAAFNKLNSVSDGSELGNITQFFHILDSVAMVKGSTITDQGKYDITTYSCCINATKGIYYYKTYDNSQINAIKMDESTKTSKKLTIFKLLTKQNINYFN